MIQTWVEKAEALCPALDELRFDRDLPSALDMELYELGEMIGGWSIARANADLTAHMTHLQERAMLGSVHTGHWSTWTIGQGGEYDYAEEAGHRDCERLAREFHKRATDLIAKARRVLA